MALCFLRKILDLFTVGRNFHSFSLKGSENNQKERLHTYKGEFCRYLNVWSNQKASAFSFLRFSSDINTYLGLVRGGNLDLSPLRFQVPELQEETGINKAFWCQQTGTPHITLSFSLVCFKHQLEKLCTLSAASLRVMQISPLACLWNIHCLFQMQVSVRCFIM